MKSRFLFLKTGIALMVLLTLSAFSDNSKGTKSPDMEVKVDTTKVLRKVDRHMFLGTNIAIWNNAETFKNSTIINLFHDFSPGIIRIPGGSMSDAYFWNGNGVRKGNGTPDSVDRSKYKNFKWDIDYSDWAPGFNGFEGYPKDPATAKINTWHGNSSVKDLHEFIKIIGAEQLVTVNAGAGTPEDAAQWVKWANQKMKYNARYWEIGNELDGGWESGHIRPDGREMNGKIYAELFNSFAQAMRKQDPTIKIGGPTGSGNSSGYIPDLLQYAGDQVDFISYHDYYTIGMGSLDEMFSKLTTIKVNAKQIKDLVRKYQPTRIDKIPVGLTEWNSKLYADVFTSDLFNGLWSAAAIGEMMNSELDYACQWDGFTQNPESGGGHGLIIEKSQTPKSQFWAFNMLNRYFGDEVLEAGSKDSHLKVYASRDKKGRICLLAVNISEKNNISTQVQLKGFEMPGWCDAYRFSSAEYKWNPATQNTLWNTGPSHSVLPVNASHQFTFPAYSVTILRFTPTVSNNNASIQVLGPEKGIAIAGQKAMLKVLALNKEGKPWAGKTISASFKGQGFSLVNKKVVTSPNGTAVIEFRSPNNTMEDTLVLSCAGVTQEHTVSSVQPEIQLLIPDKVPDDVPVHVEIYALTHDAQNKPIPGFNKDFVLNGPNGNLKGTFHDGIASVDLGKVKPGNYKCNVQLASLSLTSKDKPFQVYGLVEKEHIVLKFDEPADMSHVAGKGNNKIDTSIKANQGVLAVNLNGYTGHTQDYLNIVGLDKITTINWSKVVAVTFEMKLSDDYSASNGKSSTIFALQSYANYWMPLKEIPLNTMKKGDWVKVRLDIDKPDWQKAMKGLFQIVVIFESDKKQQGTLYLDNLGFIEKTERL